MGFYGNVGSVTRTSFQFDKIYPNRWEMEQNTLADSIFIGRFILIDYDIDNNYSENYYIDNEKYNAGRGYDSTVWQKTYVDNKEKYVMIAELGAVIPTFDISPDAPTMNPIEPHFDPVSTNIYYKLHWQAPWGFRIAEANNSNQSDETVEWITYHYDESNNTYNQSTAIKNAAIYYNKDAFDPQLNQSSINKHDITTANEIKVSPTGVSGNKYNAHNGFTSDLRELPDIQEMTINLPAIGNMMSDAWDIIHGPNRNDDMRQIDENGNNVSSLQGRLNSIDQLAYNTIPLKQINNGALVGTTINGDQKCNVPDQGILNEELSNSFEQDDAWIVTAIDSSKAPNAIAIHHTFHAKDDTESSFNINNNGDSINLYSPIVDKAGHVVGKNIETVILPYGFKTISTNGENTSIVDMIPSMDNIVANNTQDTLAINAGNKWIHIATNDTNNAIAFAHEVNFIDNLPNNSSNLNLEENANHEENINIPDWTYDTAGHITSKKDHTYTLPFGFKTIKTNGRSDTQEENATTIPIAADIIADTTQDELSINSGNKWIRIDTNPSNDSLTISHDIHDTTLTTSTQSLSSENEVTTFNVQEYNFDVAGHYISHDVKTITMPFGYGKVEGDMGQTEASATFDTLAFKSDNWLTAIVSKDTVEYKHDYPNEKADTTSSSNMNSDKTDSITLETLVHDDTGHITNVNQHTVILPYGYKEFRDSNSNEGRSIADNTQDIFIFKGDSWIKPTVSTDLATFEHIGPVSKVHTSKTNVEPKFGETFTIEDHYFDDNGHKYSTETHTVLLPKGSLTDGASNGADVITKLSFIADTGALSSTRTNISELLLTGYEKKDSSTDIANTDTLAQALSKLQTQIHDEEKIRAADDDALRTSLGEEIARADAAEKQVLIDAKAYTDQVKKEILIGESNDTLSKTYDTLLEISHWIEGDGVNTTELTEAIAEESNRAQQAEEVLNNSIKNESQSRVENINTLRTELQLYTDNSINQFGSAAYKDEDYFILKSKYDADMQVQEARIIGLNTEAKRLTNEVIALTERITALENLIKQLT